MTNSNKQNMTTGDHSPNTSDYGDFGEDTEEIQILSELLAKAEEESRVVTLKVTDIEDYEHPQGLLLPKSLENTKPAILRDDIENRKSTDAYPKVYNAG